MKKNIFAGALGMAVLLLSACGGENRDDIVLEKEAIPTAVSIQSQEQSQALKGSVDEYSGIYGQMVAEKEGDGLTFFLICLDDDEVPELVVCDSGYGTYSVYTVKDGQAFSMVDSMTAVELACFERTGVIAQFARWDGGGDEGGYGWYYYQVSADKTLSDGETPVLHDSYDAAYNGEGAEEGVTKYYYMDQEIDEAEYRQRMTDLGIVEGNEKFPAGSFVTREEMLEQLGWGMASADPEAQGTSATEGQILNQSFTTELDGFGRVIFAPFVPVDYPSENPDYGTTMFGDVRFMLLSPSDGQKIYDFPGETQDNILIGYNRFTQVLSVAFRDYNNDGRADILLLLEYEDSNGHVFRKARAYTQNEGEKEFRIDRGLSEYLGDYTEGMDRIYEGIHAYGNKFSDILGTFSVWDIERFAKKVKKQILEGDYEGLAGECSYPIQIDGEMYISKDELLAAGALENLPQAFVDVIREETCEDMFHNWQGFMLGNGEVWISEVLNEDLSSAEIKIIGFNNIRKGQELTEAGNDPVQTGTPQADPAREAYGSVLDKLYKTYTLPDGTDLGYDEIQDLSVNQFAIYDIDQDGKEELVIIWTTTYTAGMSEIIYDYDSASGSVRTELFEYPMLTFYDNSVVEAGLSHNHGLAGDMDFWPYTLYRYDKNTDTYAVIAEVDAWNKAFYEKDYNDRSFPDDMDDDGDGILYKIMIGEREELMDLDEYKGWRDSVIGAAQKEEIPFVKMTEESVRGKGSL